MMANEDQKDGWRSELRLFFNEIKREDKAFADHITQVAHFYADTARPALEEAGHELALYGRECETGEEEERVYIIVRDHRDKVEFQYAIVAEVKIEGITPYAHCWYEEAPTGEAQSGQQDDGEQKQDEAQPDGNGEGGEKDEQAQDNEKDDEGEKDSESKSSGQPKRTKTIEPLSGWSERRELRSVTREEIVNDFIAHYKEAIARLRAPKHIAKTNPQ